MTNRYLLLLTTIIATLFIGCTDHPPKPKRVLSAQELAQIDSVLVKYKGKIGVDSIKVIIELSIDSGLRQTVGFLKGRDSIFLFEGSSALNIASEFNYKDLARILIDLGANVDKTDKNGTTPLAKAASNGNLDIAKMLIAAGAKVDSINNWCETPLTNACSNGKTEMVRLLLDSGADIERNGLNGTPLCYAVSARSPQTVKLLVERGARIDVANEFGYTPLILAFACSSNGSAKILLDAGAPMDAVARDKSVLRYASFAGYYDLADRMIAAGATFVPGDFEELIGDRTIAYMIKKGINPKDGSILTDKRDGTEGGE